MITRFHLRLTAWISLFVLLLVGVSVFFKETHVGFFNTPTNDLLVLLVFIPAFWFGLWMAWLSCFDGKKANV